MYRKSAGGDPKDDGHRVLYRDNILGPTEVQDPCVPANQYMDRSSNDPPIGAIYHMPCYNPNMDHEPF